MLQCKYQIWTNNDSFSALGPPSFCLHTFLSTDHPAISNQCALKIPVLSLQNVHSVNTIDGQPLSLSIQILHHCYFSEDPEFLLLLCPLLPKIEFNSFWSLTNPIAIIYRFGLQQTLKPKRDWDELIWASSSSSCKRGKSLINKFHFSRCWTQFREWFVFFNKRKVLDLFSKQNGLFFCWFSFCRFTCVRMKTSL